MRKPLPSTDIIQQLLEYDPITGLFTWRKTSSPTGLAGTIAGSRTSSGYWAISIYGTKYQAHRLAWKYVTGSDPVQDIDHINGERDDNRWANLRSATLSQNCANSTKQRNNRTGYKGVSVLAHTPNRWQAQIHANGKNTYLGIFPSPELAHQAYMAAARKAHGEYATDGERVPSAPDHTTMEERGR